MQIDTDALCNMQAHFINNRTMEIFRHIQGMPGRRSLAASVAASSPPLEEWRKFVYCESATGSILGEVDHFKVDSQCFSSLIMTYFCLLTPTGDHHTTVADKQPLAAMQHMVQGVCRQSCELFHDGALMTLCGTGPRQSPDDSDQP